MSTNFNTNTVNNDEWLTPPYILKALGEFDLDPCAPVVRPWDTAKKHYDFRDNGLAKPWEGRVWCNPPYGRETFAWLNKLAEHGKGTALIFARTETKGFHSEIWNKAHAVFFFQGRLKFHFVNGRVGNCANAPSCLVSYSNYDTEKIAEAISRKDLQGKLIILDGADYDK